MIKGELLPTAEEELKEKGHANIHVKIQTIKGKVFENEEFEIGFGLGGSIFITFRHREVKFDVKDMVTEAVKIIEKVTQK